MRYLKEQRGSPVNDIALTPMKQPIKISKVKEPLAEGELKALKKIGVIAANWYAVTYDENQMPFAIFDNEPYAIAYRDKFSATSIVEPWPMIIKDMRKPDLKKRAKVGL